jgi:hypothetical protein
MNRLAWLLVILVCLPASYVIVGRILQARQAAPLPLLCDSRVVDSPGLCPWRSPKDDMRAFFPGADHYVQHLLILSDLRMDVLHRLGPGGLMDANGMYCYRIFHGTRQVGSVLAQRAPGEYGAVEYVAAMLPNGRIAGIRIQRLREPDATAHAIRAPRWLHAFVGKNGADAFRLGADLPRTPEIAQKTAVSLADSIRRLTIEFDVAQEHGR